MAMETLGKLQNDIKDKITKGQLNFKKTPKDRMTVSYIKTRLEALESQWLSFIDTHRQIVTDVKDEDFKGSGYYKNNIYDVTEELFINYKTELKEKLLSLSNTSDKIDSRDESNRSPNICNSSQSQCSFRLPKISIPKFSGSYSEWITFRDLYVSLIHNNTTLDDVHKLHYLKTQLTGEAEQLLRHIPITSYNYASCWKKLCDRYNNRRYLCNNIFRRLFGQKVLQAESSSGLKELVDNMSDCLNALDNLGVSTKGWDAIIIYLMSQKLDSDTRKQWELKSNELNDELPTLTSFREFLEHKFRSLEYLDTKGNSKLSQKSVNVHNVDISEASEQIVNTMKIGVIGRCPRCEGEHKIFNCKEFAKDDYSTRHHFIQTNKLCFNCLASNHSVYTCRQSLRCKICKRKHHSLLHPPNSSQSNSTGGSSSATKNAVMATVTKSQDESNENVVTTCFSKVSSQVLLATALTKAVSRTGDNVIIRCLLDQGSQASFVTESVVQTLGLKKIPNKIFVSGMGSEGNNLITSKHVVMIKLKSVNDPEFTIEVKAHVLSKLTRFLPSRKVQVVLNSNLPKLELADPQFDTPNKIDMLLGAEIYAQILEEGMIKGPPGTPIAQNTKFGWILSGCVQSENFSDSSHNLEVTSMHIQAVYDMSELLKQFWEIEGEEVIDKVQGILSEEETRCEELFRQTTTRDESGRYIVKLPFRNDDPQCKYSNSQEIAKRSLQSLENRLVKNPELKKCYCGIIEEYLELSHMKAITREELDRKLAVYLPHHPVVKEDKSTTPVRVVFNASAKGHNGVSLNDDLMVGPTLQPDLRNIVMRWRIHPICLVADITKMYRQIIVQPEDTNFQRVLWRDETGEIQHYKLLRVTFGMASAPYLAVRSLQQVAYDEGEGYEDLMLPSERNKERVKPKISKEVAERVISDYYMDDLMTGCSTLDEGLKIYGEMKEMLQRGGFVLQKWNSSSKKLLEGIGEDLRETRIEKSLEISGKGSGNLVKVLGVTWNSDTDEIEYTVRLPNLSTPVTKRKIISDIARLFDPLGWISPVIIRAKIFIQKLWISGIDWDEQITGNLLQEWLSYRQDLLNLKGFRIPRWIQTEPHQVDVELHGFSDASSDAYAAVIYTRTRDANGVVNVNLITSKTKVAPIKQVSIPRLELCGATLLAKLLTEVSKTLKIPKKDVHAWTDSSVVLAWLSSHPSKWKPFVGNRVSEIISRFDKSYWSHVKSEDNPADCASRGIKPAEIVGLDLWRNGPSWLKNNKITYSPLEELSREDEVNTEQRLKIKTFHAIIPTNEIEELMSRFSSLNKLKRVLSYCRRFIILKCSRVISQFPRWLTHVELQETLVICIKLCQINHFSREIQEIQKSGSVSKQSNLYSLSPFLDTDGILRVGGRLEHTDWQFYAKHPIVIPHNSRLADLIIADAHIKTLHGGPQVVVHFIRRTFWIIRLKNSVKEYIRKCVTCVRHSHKTIHPLMGQLPQARVTPERVFKKSGVDYAGPIAVRTTKGRGHHATKGYICLFVCLATKAIHLEAVSDLTSEGFLAAFKRFVARRGHCAELWSDNGSNFTGAARELRSMLQREKSSMSSEIAAWLENNGTSWHKIPPHAPNFGGLWEAGVKSTKHHLKRVIGTTTLTFEELTTVLSQIEACLNSRPMSRLSESPDDVLPLTPGHFLIGEPLLLLPEANYEQSEISPLKRWQLTQKMVQNFWRRWSQEYLSQFFYRYKWNHRVSEPKIGDVVLVMENDMPPARWLYGMIVEKHTGSDGVTRVVSLRCKDNIIKRPISKICILPIAD